MKRLWCWFVGHRWQEATFTEFRNYIPAEGKRGNIYRDGHRVQVIICERCLSRA